MARGAALGLVAVALACALFESSSAYRHIHDQASATQHQAFLERQLAGAYASEIDPSFLLAASELIPRTATFAVQSGNGIPNTSPITLDALPPYAQFWLFPRREVSLDRAEWLLCYGCDLKDTGVASTPRWSGSGSESIERIRR